MKIKLFLVLFVVLFISLASLAPSANALTLTRSLHIGMTGSKSNNYDVKQLQTFLNTQKSVTPKIPVTNYFGPKTFAAVKQFQAAQTPKLPATGFVGTMTKAAIASAPAVVATTSCGSGDGSAGNPIQVCTWTQLNGVRSNLSANYILEADLSSTDSDYAGIGNSWVAIGDSNNPFSGSFNGNRHTISSLIINIPTSPTIPAPIYVGLFGWTTGNISNVGLVNASISSLGSWYVGAVVGYLSGGTISNSYSTGSIAGLDTVGGLVGNNAGGTISESYSSANVSTASYNGNDVGGLVGGQYGGTISNSYATGSVSASGRRVGGLVGDNTGAISNSYSTGAVSAPTYAGGLVGLNSGTVTNSYWDINTSGQTTSGQVAGAGGTGETTAQMKTQSSFTGWDITYTALNLNNGYPYLGWQNGDKAHTWFIYVANLPPMSTVVVEGTDAAGIYYENGILNGQMSYQRDDGAYYIVWNSTLLKYFIASSENESTNLYLGPSSLLGSYVGAGSYVGSTASVTQPVSVVASSGSPFAAATGIYSQDGIYNGYMSYKNMNGAYYIAWNTTYNEYIIATSKDENINFYFNGSLTGAYYGQQACANGTLLVGWAWQPVITAFAVSNSSTLTVPITQFTAQDDTGVTGYVVNEAQFTASTNNAVWSPTPPTSYTFTSTGIKTLCAWAKNSANVVSAPKCVSVTVNSSCPSLSAPLQWDRPVVNTDGTPISGLAGYKIYWGTASRGANTGYDAYPNNVDVGLGDPAVDANGSPVYDPFGNRARQHTISGVFLSNTTYYFALTAYTGVTPFNGAFGNESAYSIELPWTTPPTCPKKPQGTIFTLSFVTGTFPNLSDTYNPPTIGSLAPSLANPVAFTIERSATANGPWTTRQTIIATSTAPVTFTDTNVPLPSYYQFFGAPDTPSLTVTGAISPNAAGNYSETGTYNGMPSYFDSGNNYWIFFDSTGKYYIGLTKGDYINAWSITSSSPIGTYQGASAGYSGNPIVSVSSCSPNYSSCPNSACNSLYKSAFGTWSFDGDHCYANLSSNDGWVYYSNLGFSCSGNVAQYYDKVNGVEINCPSKECMARNVTSADCNCEGTYNNWQFGSCVGHFDPNNYFNFSDSFFRTAP